MPDLRKNARVELLVLADRVGRLPLYIEAGACEADAKAAVDRAAMNEISPSLRRENAPQVVQRAGRQGLDVRPPVDRLFIG